MFDHLKFLLACPQFEGKAKSLTCVSLQNIRLAWNKMTGEAQCPGNKSVLQIKTKIVSFHTADSKPVKQEVNGTVILPPLVFHALVYFDAST